VETDLLTSYKILEIGTVLFVIFGAKQIRPFLVKNISLFGDMLEPLNHRAFKKGLQLTQL